MKKRFVWLIPGGFSCESLKALVTHPISMWHMMIDIGWQIPILFETPRYQCLWSTNKPWKSHHVWWPGFSCHTGALQACHLHNSAQNIEAQSPSHLLREYSWAAQWDAQLTKSEHSTHQRLNDMGIHNVYAQCLQKVPNIGHIYIYIVYMYKVCTHILCLQWDNLWDYSLWSFLTTCQPPTICSEAQSFHGGHALGWRRVTGQQGRLPRDHAQQAPQGAGEVASTTFGLRMKVHTTPKKKQVRIGHLLALASRFQFKSLIRLN